MKSEWRSTCETAVKLEQVRTEKQPRRLWISLDHVATDAVALRILDPDSRPYLR